MTAKNFAVLGAGCTPGPAPIQLSISVLTLGGTKSLSMSVEKSYAWVRAAASGGAAPLAWLRVHHASWGTLTGPWLQCGRLTSTTLTPIAAFHWSGLTARLPAAGTGLGSAGLGSVTWAMSAAMVVAIVRIRPASSFPAG